MEIADRIIGTNISIYEAHAYLLVLYVIASFPTYGTALTTLSHIELFHFSGNTSILYFAFVVVTANQQASYPG